MSGGDWAMLAATLSGVTLLTVFSLAFRTGRWMGRTDTRLDNIEQRLHIQRGGN